MSEAPSRTILDIMKGCKSFNDLPDDPGPFAERKIFLHQRSYDYIPPSKVDAEDAKYQEYLRSKWPCLEAMPEEFDPDKLEAVWQRQYASRIGDDSYSVNSNSSLQQDDYDSDAVELTFDQGYSPRHVYPLEGNSSSDSVNSGTSITKSLDSDEELEDYESEVVLKHASTGKVVQVSICDIPQASAAIVCQASMDSMGRQTPPRICTGSRPPLSRSALSSAGLPSPKESLRTEGPSMTLRGYPKAPKYFPFRSKVTRHR